MTSENFAPKRSLGTQAVTVAIATGLAQAIVAILYLAAARASNVEDYGHVVAAVAAGVASFGLLDLGTNALWVREISAGRLPPNELFRRATWKIVYIFGVAVAWAALVHTFLPGSPYWISGFVTFAQAFAQVVQAVMRAGGRSELVGASILIDKGTAAVVFFALWSAGVDVLVAFVLSLVIGPVTSGILSNWALLRDRRIRFVRGGPVNPWKGARNFAVSNVADTARSYDVTLAAEFGGAVAAGTYGAVNRWTQAIELLTFAFSSSSAPYMASAPSARAAVKYLRSAIWLPLLAILGSCVVILIAPWVVDLLLGEAYAGSADVLRILAAGTIASNLNQPMFVFLMARGKDRAGAVIVTTAVATILSLVAILTPSLGAIGAALAYVVGQVFLLLMLATTCARLLIKDEVPAEPVAPSVTVS